MQRWKKVTFQPAVIMLEKDSEVKEDAQAPWPGAAAREVFIVRESAHLTG